MAMSPTLEAARLVVIIIAPWVLLVIFAIAVELTHGNPEDRRDHAPRDASERD